MPIEVDGQQYLDRDEVALRLSVLPSTISGWASRGQMPKPDRYVSRAPLWLVTTIEAWEATRPGKGWRAGQ
ncbi:helix-turn-helix transcriptional regulator [Jiangella endophytica]|uniref:helix-turn-helix transcriptional regulator n=1 Tax=Jiangella endophytica TaxID=1623398 RepID=UPI0018E5504E|nr:hypothetical protein [Jiangella endophytica]